MSDFFKKCGDSAAAAVVFDFPDNAETFYIGSSDSIRAYVYGGMPDTPPTDIMRHRCAAGSLAKNINLLMRVKREINDLTDIADRLCNADMFCDGSCNSVLSELEDMYEITDYCNILKNYIIYDLYVCFMRQRRAFNKKVGLTVKGNHDKAEKCIEDFKRDKDRIFAPLLSARNRGKFTIDRELFKHETISDCSIYKLRCGEDIITVNTAHNSYIALLGMYADVLSSADRVIDNCEICDQMFVAARKNYAPVCNRTSCKREYRTKINISSRSRALENPVNDAYVKWDGKCLNYRKKLKDYPDMLEKYDKAHDKFRKKLQKAKKGLTARSDEEKIENYIRLCDDAAIDLQDLSKVLKKQGSGKEV